MGHRSKELRKPEPTPEVATSITHRIALKPNRENALVDAPYGDSDPDHPKYIPCSAPSAPMYPDVSEGRYRTICPRRKLPSLSRPTQTRSSSSTPGLNTMA